MDMIPLMKNSKSTDACENENRATFNAKRQETILFET